MNTNTRRVRIANNLLLLPMWFLAQDAVAHGRDHDLPRPHPRISRALLDVQQGGDVRKPTKAEQALLDADKRYSIALRRWREKFDQLRKELLWSGCNHTSLRDFTWEHDNGYGRQTQMPAKQCNACQKEFKYRSEFPHD